MLNIYLNIHINIKIVWFLIHVFSGIFELKETRRGGEEGGLKEEGRGRRRKKREVNRRGKEGERQLKRASCGVK